MRQPIKDVWVQRNNLRLKATPEQIQAAEEHVARIAANVEKYRNETGFNEVLDKLSYNGYNLTFTYDIQEDGKGKVATCPWDGNVLDLKSDFDFIPSVGFVALHFYDEFQGFKLLKITDDNGVLLWEDNDVQG